MSNSATGWMDWYDEDEFDEDDEDEELEEGFLDEAMGLSPEDGGGLTLEQKLALKQLELRAQRMNRAELIHALLWAHEQRYQEQHVFKQVAMEAGIIAQPTAMMIRRMPRTKKEFTEVLGYEPTQEQAMDYLEEMRETATMELDMERIVDSVD